MINAYHFIKYNEDSASKHILKSNETNATICFDFEDSIQNWHCSSDNLKLKKKYRKYFKQIFIKFHTQLQFCRFGVRLNNDSTEEQVFDIQALASIKEIAKIHSILLPKTESNDQVDNLIRNLEKKQINYDEIIPIIESKKGIDIIQDIIKNYPRKIKDIGFGHCDYNMNIKTFPFFHQDSREYWKWICKIYSIIKPYNVKLINSAFLELDNDIFFDKMLSYMKSICGDSFGQFTLTYKQSLQCKNLNIKPSSDFNFIKDRIRFKPVALFTENLVNSYKTEEQHLGFTIVKKNRLLLSPHEFISANKYLSSVSNKNIELYFLGGCLPVQHNILVEENFLQLIKKKLEESNNTNLNINILRYERFSNCLEKFQKQNKMINADVLVFHIRPEPYLRMLKFYYKYKNNEGKIRRSINFPALNIILSEKYDYFEIGIRYPESAWDNISLLHKRLIDVNYLLGSLIRNHYYALKKYIKLVDNVIDYCNKNNIALIILGPTLRSQTRFERMSSSKFSFLVEKSLLLKKVNFISGIDKLSKDQKEYFNLNGIHANEKYHKLISQRILSELLKLDNSSREMS